MRFLTALPVALSFLGLAFGNDNNGSVIDHFSWAGHGGGPANRRFAEENNRITSSNVHTLHEHCRLTYQGGLTSTPTAS